MKKILNHLLFKLIFAMIAGIVIGIYANVTVIGVVSTVKSVLGNFIFYMVPLIILGFVAPAIVGLQQNAGKILRTSLLLCYLSSIGAGFFSFLAGKAIIPYLNIANQTAEGKLLPEKIFELNISPIMPVMTALVTAILIGLSVVWTKSERWGELLAEFNRMIFAMVDKVIIRILPFYIATAFSELAYEGVILNEFPVFIKVLLLVIVGHYIWLAVLYGSAGIISKTNPFEVIKHYGPAYMTAIGTMSSAATLSVALESSRNAKTLDPKVRDFVIPLCANTHLCGSVLSEVFFVMTVSKVLYGHLPATADMVLFVLLLGIFAIGAPGVPGGTVMASLGLIISVLNFDQTGTALMLSIFALQDSFGTACNVLGDGAIALIVGKLNQKE